MNNKNRRVKNELQRKERRSTSTMFVKSATWIAWLPSTSKRRDRPTNEGYRKRPWLEYRKTGFCRRVSFLEIVTSFHRLGIVGRILKRHAVTHPESTRRSPTSLRFNDDVDPQDLTRSGERIMFGCFVRTPKLLHEFHHPLKLKTCTLAPSIYYYPRLILSIRSSSILPKAISKIGIEFEVRISFINDFVWYRIYLCYLSAFEGGNLWKCTRT